MITIWHLNQQMEELHSGVYHYVGEFNGQHVYYREHGQCREIWANNLHAVRAESMRPNTVGHITVVGALTASKPRGNGYTTAWARRTFNMFTNMVRIITANPPEDTREFNTTWGLRFNPLSRSPYTCPPPVTTNGIPLEMGITIPKFEFALPRGGRRGYISGIPLDWSRSVPVMSALLYFPRLWDSLLRKNRTPHSYVKGYKRAVPVPVLSLGPLWTRFLATVAPVLQHSNNGRHGFWVIVGLCSSAIAYDTSGEKELARENLYRRARSNGMNTWADRIRPTLPDHIRTLLDTLRNNGGIGTFLTCRRTLY